MNNLKYDENLMLFEGKQNVNMENRQKKLKIKILF